MNPIISVVIPTLNRPEFSRIAVESVLRQEGNYNFEIILSNNGGGKQTFEMFNTDIYKDKIRYVETAIILPMTEHWEWASRFALGKYLMILPDRRLLRQGALKKLITAMENNLECDACCCCDEWLYSSGRVVSTKTFEVDVILSTKKILRDFENGIVDRNILPLGLNSIIRRDFIEKYRMKQGLYFEPIAPDYRSAFNFLFSAKYIYAIADPVMITTGFSLSNGGAAYKGDTSYFKSLKDDGAFVFMPRCFEGNVWGSIYEDYLRSKNASLGKAKFGDVMSKFSMKQIMVEEIAKIFFSKFSFESRKRFFEIRRILKNCGWRTSDDLIALKESLSTLRQFVPESLKKLYRLVYSLTGEKRNALQVAGFQASIGEDRRLLK